MNGIEWFFIGVPVGAGLVLLEQWLFARWRNGTPQDAPGEEETEEDVLGMVLSLQRSQKMLLGRLNKLDPPRLGTGANPTDGGSPEQLLVPPSETGTPVTRSQVLHRYHQGRTGR